MTAQDELRRFRQFLESIPRGQLGEETRRIKTVEQDWGQKLNLIIWESIYQNYWEKGNFLDFDAWFSNVWKQLEGLGELKEFEKYSQVYLEYYKSDTWQVLQDLEDWFRVGLRARLFRLWMSALTQLDFCYVFKYVCERLNKKMGLEANAELDASGVNLRVGTLDFQIAKISERPEARVPQRTKVINIPYPVWDLEYLENHSYPGSSRVWQRHANQLIAFAKHYKRLRNGFVVFGEDFIEAVVTKVDNPEALRDYISHIVRELSGQWSV